MAPKNARELTIKIFAIILHYSNGYTKEEIKEDNLAEDCEGHEYFTEIEELLTTIKTR